jgi:hypothetical protein
MSFAFPNLFRKLLIGTISLIFMHHFAMAQEGVGRSNYIERFLSENPLEDRMEINKPHLFQNILRHVETDGLRDGHYFYITFDTQHPGVEIPDYLRSKYPNDMTMVLQYEFWDLSAADQQFSVLLKFDGRLEKVVIPYTAIRDIMDPSINFRVMANRVI